MVQGEVLGTKRTINRHFWPVDLEPFSYFQ